MMTINLARAAKKSRISYSQIINDILGVINVCIVIVWSDKASLVTVVQMLFAAVAFYNAYMSKQKINIICLWAFIFYGFCIMSILWAYSTSGALLYRNTMLKMMLLVFSVSLYAKTKREIDILLKSFILGTAILAVMLFVSTPIELWGTERLGAELEMNQNAVGAIFVYASMLCMYYARKTNPYFLLFVVFASISMFTGSRRAFLMILLIIIIFFFSKLKKLSDVLYIIPFGLLIFLLIYSSMNIPLLYNVLGRRLETLFNFFSGEGRVDNSTIIRMELISSGIEQFKERMLIGHGLNSFKYLNRYDLYAHNNYVELLVNYGLIGTVLYYSMILAIMIRAFIALVTKAHMEVLPVLIVGAALIGDFGTVSYYSVRTIILLIIAYQIGNVSDGYASDTLGQAVV